jgi:hypothetical protein
MIRTPAQCPLVSHVTAEHAEHHQIHHLMTDRSEGIFCIRESRSRDRIQHQNYHHTRPRAVRTHVDSRACTVRALLATAYVLALARPAASRSGRRLREHVHGENANPDTGWGGCSGCVQSPVVLVLAQWRARLSLCCCACTALHARLHDGCAVHPGARTLVAACPRQLEGAHRPAGRQPRLARPLVRQPQPGARAWAVVTALAGVGPAGR